MRMPIVFPGVSRKPTRLAALLRDGDAANRRRAWREAAAAYRAALELDGSLAHIWVQYGHALKEQGQLAAADDAYRRSLALDAALADTHLQLGHVLKLQGRVDEAADAYLTAYRRDRELPYPEIELRALGVELPPGLPNTEITAEPAFVAAVYGGAAAGLAPGSGDHDAPVRYVSREHLLRVHGLDADVLEFFDHRFYFYANPVVQSALAKPDRYTCLVHFCTQGIDAVLPCSEAYRFDPEFYTDAYLECRLGPANAYWHWLAVGLRKGWHPNRDNWLSQKLGADKVRLGAFDFASCMAFFYDPEKPARWTDLFARFVDNEVLRPGPHLPVTGDTADLFTAIARRLAAEGRADDALALYQRILASVPDHPAALHNYADCLREREHFLEALKLYRLPIERGAAPAACFLGAALCCERLGNLGEALTLLKTGIDRLPAEAQLKSRFDAVAEEFFESEWRQALATGKTGRYREAQARVADACAFLTALMPVRQRLPARPLRSVAIVGNLGMPQCTFYRIEQKLEHLRAAGYDAAVYHFIKEPRQFLDHLADYEAVVFYRVPATGPMIEAISRAREFGLVTFYDIDDFIFGGDDYPGSFESFFGQITLDQYVELKLGVPAFRQAIALCDYGIASTPALAAEMAKILPSGQAFVHRNALGRQQEIVASKPPPAPAGEPVTIFYGSATKSHKDDFRDLVEPALVEIVRRHGDRVHIVMVGYTVMSPALESIRRNLTLVDPIWDVDGYWAILKSADINVAVLKQTAMTDCKSEIKWLEAAMFGVPSVVSGTATYREVIEPDVTGLICDTVEDWIAALDRLVRDPDLRRRIGLAARQRVREAYGVRHMSENLAAIFARTMPQRATSASKPKIVVVNVYYPPESIGGATRVVTDNVGQLVQRYGDAFDFEVFATRSADAEDYALRCHLHDGVRVTTVSVPAVESVERALSDARIEKVFGDYLDRARPALVHFHCLQRLTASVVAAAAARGIPYLITVHDGWWISNVQFIVNEDDQPELYDYTDPLATGRRWGGAAYGRLMQLRAPLFGAAKVLAVSAKFAELYRSCGVPNVIAVENGIANIARKPRLPAADDKVRLGFLGGIGFAKGYELIKYALLGRKFEHLRLIVIDTDLPPGSARAEQWNTTPVAFIPKYPEDRIAELYAEIDVLLAPSVCIESFGLVAREALHCGCWVVASDRGSIGDCVTHGENGYVIDVSDTTELTRVLRLIDDMPQRYQSPPAVPPPPMRRASEQADELAELYRSIVGSRPAATAASSRGSAAALCEKAADLADDPVAGGGG